jgi:hypothetical protein
MSEKSSTGRKPMNFDETRRQQSNLSSARTLCSRIKSKLFLVGSLVSELPDVLFRFAAKDLSCRQIIPKIG